jgi:hypothetical protein
MLCVMFINITSENFFYFAIDELSLTVRLRVIGGRQTESNAQNGEEAFPEMTYEDWVTIQNDFCGEAVVSVNVFIE